MQTRRGTVGSLLIIALSVCLLLGASALVVTRIDAEEPEARIPPPVVEVERDGLRFAYHIPTGQASLFDVANDPHFLRNLIDDRPDDARRLQAEILRDFGVESLEDLREHYRDKKAFYGDPDTTGATRERRRRRARCPRVGRPRSRTPAPTARAH